ncbi:sialic acid binding Ig-like lectin 15, like isoform X3 [Synchiropus splendidus]|uniref:sialic acid binding Ig-like lectin 15, like isoform X3 n=1 Tax=Synchiropus splendidus TaxID=270530 RepID=UPI00237E36BE|nr:sialic acid binding Ig-like lectin 15, like isoform X3 [Synchiropus splendidus]
MKALVLLLLWTLSSAALSNYFDLLDALGSSGDSMNPHSQSVFNMSTCEEVHTMRGDNALLNCSFTHPRFGSYLGRITVKWMARDPTTHPFFTCSVNNSSDADVSKCSYPGYKYALAGDPRQGALSLLIKDVTPVDEEVYFCRVEFEDEGGTSRGINLRIGGETHFLSLQTQVTAGSVTVTTASSHWQLIGVLILSVKPQILILKELNGTRNGRSLECVAEGKPPPHISWFSKSKCQLDGLIDAKRSGPARVTSYVWSDQDDRITCRAENPLGRAEQAYPPRSALVLTVRVAVFGVVLLVTVALVVCKLRPVGCSDSQHSRCPSGEDPQAIPLDFSPIYQNQAGESNSYLPTLLLLSFRRNVCPTQTPHPQSHIRLKSQICIWKENVHFFMHCTCFIVNNNHTLQFERQNSSDLRVSVGLCFDVCSNVVWWLTPAVHHQALQFPAGGAVGPGPDFCTVDVHP